MKSIVCKRGFTGAAVLLSGLAFTQPACSQTPGSPPGSPPGSAQGAAPIAGALIPSSSDSLVCRVIDRGRTLPEEVRETSGLAQSRNNESLFWTHNDSGGGAELFALTVDGKLARRVTVSGAKSVDWEDIESGPCKDGSCLYVADTGDNDRVREMIDVYRIVEPALNGPTSVAAHKFSMRYPDGAQDAEAIFISPAQDLFVVTKGRHGAIVLYGLPAPHDGGAVRTLTRIRELFPQPKDENDRVTAATMSPDGKWVAVRTYRQLHFYRANALTTGSVTVPMTLDLAPLAEVQGEAVTMSNDGSIWLSSEAEDKRMMPTWSRIKCTMP